MPGLRFGKHRAHGVVLQQRPMQEFVNWRLPLKALIRSPAGCTLRPILFGDL